VSSIVPLTGATRFDLPAPCVSCVFWQDHSAITDERRKEAWTESFSRRHGAFGRVMHEGARFRGMIQYGPAGAFPRALGLPAGPPGRDAALVTCTYLDGEDPAGACERLMLEALADLKAQGVVAVEAFSLSYPEEVPPEDRFLGHHTLLDRDLLERLGFSIVRTHGQVGLMRIALGGLIPEPGIVEKARRLGERLLEAPVRPAPA
jgi:hypothetical protein